VGHLDNGYAQVSWKEREYIEGERARAWREEETGLHSPRQSVNLSEQHENTFLMLLSNAYLR